MTHDIILFLHTIGFVAMGGMFLFAYAGEVVAWRSGDLTFAAGALRLKGALASALLPAMALLTLVTGAALGLRLGYGLFSPPWFAAIWVGFIATFTLGRTVTRPHGKALYKAMAKAESAELARLFRQPVKRVIVAMDAPMVAFLIFLGVVRPMQWSVIAAALAVALLAAVLMAWLVLAVGPKAEAAARASR